MTMHLLSYLHRVVAREDLSSSDARLAMLAILSGEASTAQVASFLIALKMKGETAAEITGFAQAMREMVHPVRVAPDGMPLVDTCGTGGDGTATFNISTVAAFVTAGAGVRVAKHGNRSISGKCGSADLLEALGVPVALDPAHMGRAIETTGMGFLYAPALNPAMKHAQPARLELKTRTVFNLLGPLTNPASASHQLIGAPSPASARLMADALAALGTERALIVHGSDGMDEITTTGSTTVFEVLGGAVTEACWTPEDFGVRRASMEDLRGGDAAVNREIAARVLAGGPGPAREIVLVNSAAALFVAGAARSLKVAMRLAAESIDSGAASEKLRQLKEFSSNPS